MGRIPSGAIAHVGEPENGMVVSVAEDVKGGLQNCVGPEDNSTLGLHDFEVSRGRGKGMYRV